MTKILTVAEVCDILQVSRTTVYRIIKEKELKAIKIRKTVRVKESDLEEYLSSYEEAV